MTLISLAHSGRLLGIDPKTLRHWVRLAQFSVQVHPQDHRVKCLSRDHLEQMASAHHRSLSDSPASQVSADPTVLPAHPSDTGDGGESCTQANDRALIGELTHQVDSLQSQMVLLQQHLAQLTERLPQEPPRPAGVSRTVKQNAQEPSHKKLSASPRVDRRKEPHVLSRVEYGTQDTYAMISPELGRLSLEPDSPAWFAWLSTLASFRFVGQHGHCTAYRGYDCSAGTSWWAYRQIHSHCRKQRIGTTDALTIEALERTASSLQALI